MNKGSNKRARPRGNNNRRPSGGGGGNSNRTFDSSGPDSKVRGSAQQVADKYLAMARDALLSGERTLAENYFQHADHYHRVVAENQSVRNANQPSRGRHDNQQQPSADQPGLAAPQAPASPSADVEQQTPVPAPTQTPAPAAEGTVKQVEIEFDQTETPAAAPTAAVPVAADAPAQEAPSQDTKPADEAKSSKGRGVRRGLRGRPRRPRTVNKDAAKAETSGDDAVKADPATEVASA